MNSRYEIRETIGQGGLGSVYKAFDTQLQREVAMKRVLTTGQGTPEEIKAAGNKLISEAQTLSTLNHPNIVTVFDVGQDEAGGFVVMELLKGETLDETVERGVLTADDFKEVVFQTMEGLIAAQDKNVIHRDIKPTNIMLIWQASGRFQLKILDFGLAKFSKNPSVQTMDQDEAVMGSIFFMAPEQFERGELDARTDLYQMGCVYYNALTGQYPFNGETAPQVMNAHLQHKVVPLEQLRPDLPPPIAQWVMWLINRDIQSRPSNAKEALRYFPRNADSAPALPAQPVKRISTPVSTASPSVRIATPVANASAPPNLIVAGSSTKKLTGSQTESGSAPRKATASQPGAKANPKSATVSTRQPQPGTAPKKKKLSPTLIVSVVGAIAIGIVAGMLKLKSDKVKANAARLEFLSEQDAAEVSLKDVDLLLDFMVESPDFELKKDAYEALKKVTGNGVDEAILKALTTATSSAVQKQLSIVLATRGYLRAIGPILNLAKLSPKEEDKVAFLSSAKALASSDNMDVILEGLKSTESPKLRRLYEDMLLVVLHKTGNTEAILNQLRQAIKGAGSGERRSLFRVLGQMGGKKTEDLLDQIMKGTDAALKSDAISAYFSWPDRTPLPKIAVLAASQDKTIRSPALRAYGIVSGKPGPFTIGQYIEDWQKGFDMMKDTDQGEAIRLIQRVIVGMPHPRTVGMLEGWKEHPKYGTLVKAVSDSMNKTLSSMTVMESGKPLKGSMAQVEGDGAAVDKFLEAITNWTSAETYFSWNFKAKEAGEYSISVDQADLSPNPSDFVIYVAGQALKGKSEKTSNLEEFSNVKVAGKVKLEAGEVYKLTLVAGEIVQPRMMNVKAVTFTK